MTIQNRIKEIFELKEAQKREFALLDQLDIVTKRNSELAGKIETANKILNTCKYESWESFDEVINNLKKALNSGNETEAIK